MFEFVGAESRISRFVVRLCLWADVGLALLNINGVLARRGGGGINISVVSLIGLECVDRM